MFEKEAEEWIKENMDCCKTDNSVNQSIPYFNEEERCIAKSAFIDGAKFGYNKANKWHYTSNGEYPKEYADLLICYLTEDDKKDCVRGWYEYDFDNDEHIFKYDNLLCTLDLPSVIAWKELVLP